MNEIKLDPLDYIGSRAPYLYIKIRLYLVIFFLFFTAGWVATGWDGTIQQILPGGRYGQGIHWSTFQVYALCIYALLINLQYGGLKSVRQILSCLKNDCIALLYLFTNRRRFRDYGGMMHSSLQTVEPIRAFMFSLLVATGALFIFEVIWVFAYNWFHFGDLWWPVYYANAPLEGGPLSTYQFHRNIWMSLPVIPLAPLSLWLARVKKKGKYFSRYRLFFKKDRFAIIFLSLFVLCWMVWIDYPLNHKTLAPDQLNATNVLNSYDVDYDRSIEWIHPLQDKFPQTAYTFYAADSWLKPYEVKVIWGFHVDDPAVHFVNVMTKNIAFLAIAYPFMVKVERRKEEE